MKLSYLARLWPWSLERFPPVQFLSAFLTFAITLLPDYQRPRGIQVLAGTLVIYVILFVLRVLDEHKDFKKDLVAHPDRRLQKGLISLKDLRLAAVTLTALATGLVLIFFRHLSTFYFALPMLVWIFLMTKEFFIQDWLNRHIFAYSFSHLLLSPFLILFACAMNSNFSILTPYMIGISFLSAFSYEVARKTKGLDEVNPHEQNYTNIYGAKPSILLFSFFCLADLLVSGFICDFLDLPFAFFALFSTGVLVIYCAFRFHKNPNKKNRQINEGVAALVGLLSFALPLSFFFQ